MVHIRTTHKSDSAYDKVCATIVSIVTVIMILIASACPLSVAYAAHFDPNAYTGEGYNNLVTGNSDNAGGWDENVIQDATNQHDVNGDPQSAGNVITGYASNVSNMLGTLVVVFAAILSAARLAWRGIYEMTAGDNKASEPPKFTMTSKERKDGKADPHWVRDMLVETLIIFAVIIGVWVLIGVLVLIFQYIMGGVSSAASGNGFGTFSVGGISVTTS